eukprot:9016163-Pyramimonas_sp.AAC.1
MLEHSFFLTTCKNASADKQSVFVILVVDLPARAKVCNEFRHARATRRACALRPVVLAGESWNL